MPKRYSREAEELCRELYCRYGGRNHELIERDMRRAGWTGWQKSILYDKGKAANARMGWITRLGFDNSLRIYTQKLAEKVNNDEQDLYLGIKTVRRELWKKVSSGKATKDEIYQYRDFCKLEIEARRNLDLPRDNLETFVAGYEKLVQWLGVIDTAAVKTLIRHGEKLTELAQAHYGKEATTDPQDVLDGEPEMQQDDDGKKEKHDGAGTRADARGTRKGNVLAFN